VVLSFPIYLNESLHSFLHLWTVFQYTCIISNMKKTVLTLLICAFCISPVKLSAHPHMSLEANCDFLFENSELKGFWAEFHFDRYFTSDMLNSFDDGDELFNNIETEHVYSKAFINLENYGFFISIREGRNRRSPDSVSDFSVFMEDNLLVYRFFVDCTSPGDKEVFISVYDPSYFCAIKYIEENPVNFTGAERVQPDYKIIENEDFPIYYDPVAPASDNTSYDKWRPGLQTFYPMEIHLVY